MLKDAEIQHAIGEELTAHREKLELDFGMVIKGLMEVIEIARRAGQGAWQTQAMIRSYELIGKHLGMFTEKVDVNFDQKLMQLLEEGRKRAAGLVPARRVEHREDEIEPEAEKKESKPN